MEKMSNVSGGKRCEGVLERRGGTAMSIKLRLERSHFSGGVFTLTALAICLL